MDVRLPKQYLVSIILPTRKRVKDLHETLNSILDNANLDNKNFEIILKVDYDDQETINYVNQFTNQNDNINVILASRLEGWFSLVDFIETMIDVSKGKYIWNINDDSRILTKGWNDILENELTEFKIYHPLIEWGPDLNGYIHSFREIFPIYPKKLKELWGYICPHNNIDSWLYFVGKNIGLHPWNISFMSYLDNLTISHYQIPDETSKDKMDQIDRIHGLADKHENSKELYQAINLLEEYIHYIKWKDLNKHNIINEYRNQYL
jgi:glycosyltransferase involved in cell wall biosynthesis